MSICPVQKVTLFGLSADKTPILGELQELGLLHISDMNHPHNIPVAPSLVDLDAYTALKYLMATQERRRQITSSAGFDAQGVVEDALQIKDRIQELEHRRDHILEKIRRLEAWGDFTFPPLEELGGNHLWFYIVPHARLKALRKVDVPWEIVGKNGGDSHVVAISPEEPAGMPGSRVHAGAVPLSQLQQELEQCEVGVDDLDARRYELTRWCFLLARHLATAEDMANFGQAVACTFDDDVLLGIEGWVRKDMAGKIEDFARSHEMVCVLADPGPSDHPPTLLENPEGMSGGEEVVKFYNIPGYRTVDPSLPIFFLFSLFFAIIIGDAAYAVIMGLMLMGFWGKLSRSRSGRRILKFGWMIVGMSFVWGVLVGSYFGFIPHEGSLLGEFRLIDAEDNTLMMKLSIAIGVLHLILANAMSAWSQRKSLSALVPIGWIDIFAGAAIAGFGGTGGLDFLVVPGFWIMGMGALLVVLFSSPELMPPKTPGQVLRLVVSGLLKLTKITAAFGDALSYLRLFALGLAGASLAVTFNQLALNAADDLPGIGLVIAFVTLVLGHGLNIILGIMGGVVHGLRLNVLEFCNWCVEEEGHIFRAFAKKEIIKWTP